MPAPRRTDQKHLGSLRFLTGRIVIDPQNPVVMLCAEGMQAEAKGKPEVARHLFTQALERSTNDYEACIAAHFLARQQENPQDMLFWNQEALRRAGAVGDERVLGFYASLYLNVGFSFENLGNLEEARRYYELAAEKVEDLPEGAYTDIVRKGIDNGRERIAHQGEKLADD